VWSFSEGKRGRRRDNSTVSKADDTAKSGTMIGEVEGGGWCLEVKITKRN
jgi:hypothetical protein